MTADDFFQFAKKNQAEMVDLKFVDMLGSWQHCSYPVDTLDTGTFKEGLGFDGSSIRGWMGIHESDMLAVPDADTARLDPFFAKPTVSVIANIVDPVTGKEFSRDPRHIARKAEAFLKETGIADTCFIGPEPEFFIFDEVRYEQNQHRGYYEIDSAEGAWNTARIEEPNLGYKPSFKGGYFPVSPTDTYHDLRGEMVYEMRKIGIIVEAHHHEVATAGQSEIDMQFQPLLQMADQFMWYKVHLQERREAPRQDGDVHAEADLRRQRQRHALAYVAVEGREAIVRRRRLRGTESARALRRGRAAQACTRHPGVCRAHHQLLPPAGSRLRSTCQPGALGPQSLRVDSHSDVLEESEGEAAGVQVPGSELQRLSGVARHADGDDRRDPEQDRSGQTARSGYLRDDAGRDA